VKLLTRRRKPVAAMVDDGSYDAAAVVPALREGRWAVPDHFNFARDVVEVLAQDPKRRALTFLGKDGVIEPRSFLRIAEGAAKWATLMRENGVAPGDRVLVLANKTPDWLEIMLAVMKTGAVAVPCPETMSAAPLGIRVSVSGAKLVVAAEVSRGEVERIADAAPVLYIEETRALASKLPDEAPTHDTSSRDPAFVLSTSGTATGPRGVVHTHGAAFAARVVAEHWLDAGPHDAVWCTADASSGAAVWNALLGPWSRGAEIVLHQEPFDPQERLQCIRRLDTTILCQTPAEYKALLAAADLTKHRPPKLRRLVSTGEHLSADVVAAYEEAWDLTICDGYGQVETGIVVANGAGPGFRSGSIGLPLPGFDVAVVDELGNEVEPGVVGELAVRGRPPTLFAGYWEAPEETKATFRGDAYLTGDTAVSDEDGFLWFLGRSADVILTGGGRFGPVEVEEALTGHGAVADAAAVGMRDLQRGGQFVRAFVMLAPGFEPSDRLVAEIREHTRQSLAPHKVPREIEFVDSLPTTADGKLKRLELRDRPLSALAPAWSPPPAPTLAPELETARAGSAAGEPTPEPTPEPVDVSPPVFEESAELYTRSEASAPPEPAAWAEPEPETTPSLESRPETTGRAGMLDLAPQAPPESPLEPVPEPEPWQPEHGEEEPRPEPVPDPLPETTAETMLEPAPPPAPEPEPGPEPERAWEPEPEQEPTAQVDLEPISSPAVAPVAEPEPEPEQTAEVIRLAEAAPEPEPESENLPDYIVVPGTEGLREQQEHPTPTDPALDPSGLGFPPITELILDLEQHATPKPENDRPAPEAPLTERRSGKDRRRLSSHDPGDESDETGWMQGLSSRLSAYSLSEDPSSSNEPENDESEES
jgi:acetyl-CoA synthetase/medium-chain acyl-CoA synthetase